MKAAIELEKAILGITMKIQNEYPELSKYIEEMPLNSSQDDSLSANTIEMKEYYNSLVELFGEYSKTHKS